MRNLMFMLVVLALSGCGDKIVDGGPKGDPGASCTIVRTPAGAQITCPGIAPVTVHDGLPGDTGPQGPQGVAGTDATPVTTVQLCSGSTPSYPSTFAEVGICLGGQLYVVYSQNGGFLALFPPGTYVSNGINSSCNFTVSANCVVTPF